MYWCDALLYSELLVLVLACAAAAGCLLLVACRHWNCSGGKEFKIEIDSSIWREGIQNRNRLLDLAGRNSK